MIYFIKKYKVNVKLKKYRFIYCMFKKIFLIFCGCVWSNYIRYKKIIESQYIFKIKVSICSFIYIKSIMSAMYNILDICKISMDRKVFFKKNSGNKYTVLRSPFVFKKSREQLIIETNYFEIHVNFGIRISLIIEFIELLLYFIIYKLDFLKILIKKKIISR